MPHSVMEVATEIPNNVVPVRPTHVPGRDTQDIPAALRQEQERKNEDPVRLAKELGLMPVADSEYDIPAFLRKQAD